MGWREVIFNTIFGYAGTNDERTGVIADAIETRLLDMLETDRIALARELLAGSGMVPARDIEAEVEAELRGPLSLRDVQALQVGRKIGHNACRAAMLEEE